MKKCALVTGATSGFGQACAEILASNGHNLIITGRRNDRLEILREKLQEQYQVEVLALNFDVRSEEQVQQHLQSLNEKWNRIDVLINNAGLALGRESLVDGSSEDWNAMIDTNLKGLLYVSKLVAKGMQQRKSGHIINIGSIAGKQVYPGGNVYCATKFAVDAITQALRMELVADGIKVSQVSPGAALTEFSLVRFKGDEATAQNVYKGFVPLSATDIAEAVWFIVSRPAHVCINELLIMPASQANASIIHRKN